MIENMEKVGGRRLSKGRRANTAAMRGSATACTVRDPTRSTPAPPSITPTSADTPYTISTAPIWPGIRLAAADKYGVI